MRHLKAAALVLLILALWLSIFHESICSQRKTSNRPAKSRNEPRIEAKRPTSEELIKLIMQNYSRSQSPTKPVSVNVEVTIQDIVELSVLSNSFTADIWFSAIWHDPRLAFTHLDPLRNNLSFDETFEKSLWSPNVCLVNTKRAQIHSSPKPNVLLMLMSNGSVWLNYRVRVEAPCEFTLSDFPMDSSKCFMVFESYSYNTATVTVDWMSTDAITLKTDEFTASDFQLAYLKHYKHTEYYKAGEWYRLTLEIGFQRRYGFYILQVYATMYINVFLSWIAFCISLKALPARVILSVNTLMSLCLQSIDYFMFICIAYIFGSLLEMAFITYQDKKMASQSMRRLDNIGAMFQLSTCFQPEQPDHPYSGEDNGFAMGEMMHPASGSMNRNLVRQRKLIYLDRGTRIDKISFIVFPLTFLILNVVYWAYYLSKSQTTHVA